MRPLNTYREPATSVSLHPGSQTLIAQWTARANDQTAAATGTAQLAVRASTTYHFDRSIRHGEHTTFSGSLRSRTGLLDRVPVSLQVRVGRRWQTFVTVPTDADGAWSYRRTFLHAGRYRTRVAVGSVPSFPWAASRPSAERTIVVR